MATTRLNLFIYSSAKTDPIQLEKPFIYIKHGKSETNLLSPVMYLTMSEVVPQHDGKPLPSLLKLHDQSRRSMFY